MPSLPSYKHPVDPLNKKLCLMHEVLLLFGCNIDVHIGIVKGNYEERDVTQNQGSNARDRNVTLL